MGRAARRWSWAALTFACLTACGSRTPLEFEPGEGDASVEAPKDDASPYVCISGSHAVHAVQIDLYFTIDKSRSMNQVDRGASGSRWQTVSSALKSFINAPLSAGLGAGIAFFPRTAPGGEDYCATSDYAFPVVPVGVLPGVAPSILTAISLQTFSTGTPTTPALDGALIYARSHVIASPYHTTAVVMVTDGAPRGCGSTLASTSAIAAAALSGAPPIKTYVLGVGPNLSNLNTIAEAGGTSDAYLVESGGESGLLAALEAIRTSALSCEFSWPAGLKSRFDDARVSTVRSTDTAPLTIEQVASRDACGDRPGWFYDKAVALGEAPSRITLCPASCNPLVRSEGSHLDVRVGCAAGDL